MEELMKNFQKYLRRIERVYIERGNFNNLPFTQNQDFTYMNM